jgi:hypothetical protein
MWTETEVRHPSVVLVSETGDARETTPDGGETHQDKLGTGEPSKHTHARADLSASPAGLEEKRGLACRPGRLAERRPGKGSAQQVPHVLQVQIACITFAVYISRLREVFVLCGRGAWRREGLLTAIRGLLQC